METGWSAAPTRGVPAWSLSALLHLVLVVLVGVFPASSPRPAATTRDRPAGIALVTRNAADVQYFSNRDASAPSSANRAETTPVDDAGESAAQNAVPRSVTELLPSAEQLATAAALDLPTRDGLPAGEVTGLPSASGFTRGGNRQGTVSGGQASTQVFGARGQGSRFVYVFDRSASMRGFQGRPMRAARRELLNSLLDLESVHQFQIVYYNDRTSVFNPFPARPPSLLFATDENRRLAERFIRSIEPAGATRHVEALRMALALAPDVIFFLTDAAEPQLTRGELDGVRRQNRAGTTIHCIEFGSGPSSGADNFLRRLARENDGQHVYIDVNTLGE